MIKNIPPDVFNDGKVVLGEHNIEYVTLDNLAESIVNPFKKFIYRMEARRMKVYEEKIYNENKIRLYTFVSSEDKLFFEKTFGKENTLLIPVGSEIMPYKGMVRRQNIMFFGKMEYPANAEAACEFAENVFVKVLEKLPKATLYIVGKNPLPKVIKLKERFKDRIIVTGTVDSVEPYYDIASLIVVPLKHGGGVKVKVLEALGHGKLIITTQKGIEGTDFINGYHLIVAKDNKDFAQQCVNVIKEPQKFEKIRKNGYDYVKANYTWKAIIGSFEITLKNLK
jgi:glycosyltransferase involved in cell wall biosynthesis